jgi:hypothetical protein
VDAVPVYLIFQPANAAYAAGFDPLGLKWNFERPPKSAAGQSDQTNNPSKNEVRNEVGLDVSHHTRISQRRGEKFFP